MPTVARRNWRKNSLLPFFAMQLVFVSCATLHVPENAPAFKTEEFVRSAKAGLVVEAHPVAEREAYWDLFEDYLPEVGLAAIWVNIRNERTDSVSAAASRWRLLSSGREYRMLSSDELFEHYYKTRRIRAYSVSNDQHARDKLSHLLLDVAPPLRPAETRSGFVFFRVRPSDSTEWLTNSRLVLRDIQLPGHDPITLELPLIYATS